MRREVMSRHPGVFAFDPHHSGDVLASDVLCRENVEFTKREYLCCRRVVAELLITADVGPCSGG